jgi:hypothetical protein
MHKYDKYDIEIFSLWNEFDKDADSIYWNFKLLLTNCPGFGDGGTFSNDLRSSKGWLFNI